MIPQAVAVSNGKGGTGKTTLAANLCAMAAAAGWRTLAVDLDPQGNLGQDLGYWQEEKSDEGQALHASIAANVPLQPIRNVRPNLDAIAGGEVTEELIETLRFRQTRDRDRLRDLERVLATVADDYQLIVMDCPVEKVMEEAALAAAHWVIIPTRVDDGSTRGLGGVARRFVALRDAGINPDLELMGVVLFDLGARHTRIASETREALKTSLEGIAPVFDGFIRNAALGSRDMRRDGLVATEYEEAAKTLGSQLAGNAKTLASDYRHLVTEQILPSIAKAFEATPTA